MLSMRSIVSSIPCCVRFFTMSISTSAPAFSNARAVSTSQFVPGNTGMNTFGLAVLITGEETLLSV